MKTAAEIAAYEPEPEKLTRLGYLKVHAVMYTVGFACGVYMATDTATSPEDQQARFGFFVLISCAVHIWAALLRLSDIGVSRWNYLWSMIPIFGFIVWIAWFFVPSNWGNK